MGAVGISVPAEREFVGPAFPVHYLVVLNGDLIGETALAGRG